MKTGTRVFRREVTIQSEAQYEEHGKFLRIQRWRVIIDGEPGRWRKATKSANGGWPLRLDPKKIS